MIEIKNNFSTSSSDTTIFGIDFEWTKNYKIKNGNIPFCFSVICVPLVDKKFNPRSVKFGFYSCYVENQEEGEMLTAKADALFQNIMETPNKTIVGHQLHSDFSVISNYSNHRHANIENLRLLWQERRNHPFLFDTRYDLTNLTCKSRRLVDVCNNRGMDVTQPEINGSMSKMHNVFLKTQNKLIREKLSVMNLRHSLSTALLYINFKFSNNYKIFTNNILMNNLHENFDYINSTAFKELVTKGTSHGF